jgi:hypothetical protein
MAAADDAAAAVVAAAVSAAAAAPPTPHLGYQLRLQPFYVYFIHRKMAENSQLGGG